MVDWKRIKRLLGDKGVIGLNLEPPDLVLYRKDKVVVTRYLVADEAEYGVADLSPIKLYDIVERLASIIDKLPEGSEVKIVKVRSDLNSLVRRIENEMANAKASLELASEPHVKSRLSLKLKNLSDLYKAIVSGRPVLRLKFVVKIRTEARSLDEAKQILSYHSSIITNAFKSSLGFRLREAGREIEDIIAYEIGVSRDMGLKGFYTSSLGVAPVLPVPLVKKPRVDYENALLLGFDEEGSPVVIPIEQLVKHVLIIGPTGRGKTTLLASLLQNFSAIGAGFYLALDFKGDLVKLISNSGEVASPRSYPLSFTRVFQTPLEAKSVLADIVSSALNIPRENVVETVEYLYSIISDGSSVNNLRKMRADILPLIDFVQDTSRDNELADIVRSGNVIVDLKDYGYAFQTAYSLLLLYLARNILFKRGTAETRLIAIDEAWRISRTRLLIEMFKEGRSRSVGLVVSTQNPSDIPREIVENSHTILVFGSPNEKYIAEVSSMLGLDSSSMSRKISRLGVGEAVFLNALDPHPVVFKVRPPITLNSDERRAS
ncbi:ATP-binding protein [Thermogladius sp. 4427co]|uniref:ATP-binding protein n=1 Tax=Thermogladius sp. 4427co TaxID=3450718 RepID=UPI003F793B5C